MVPHDPPQHDPTRRDPRVWLAVSNLIVSLARFVVELHR